MSRDALARMAAGTLQVSFTGVAVPEWIERRIGEGVGSVCLYGSNLLPGAIEATGYTSSIDVVVQLAGELHGLNPSLVMALDEEGGDVTRLEAHRGSSIPGNAALGAAGDLALTRDVAGALGRALKLAGIDLDLAPVADVGDADAPNPAIGVRSFGSDPEAVAEHVAAFVAGLQAAGVAACAKHFPGHGATSVDSHHALPTVETSDDLLRRRELVPFRAAVTSGVAAVLLGHLRVPALDDEPATVSGRIVTDLLRSELGFDGVVMTDALDMGGIGGTRAIPANVIRALIAGADLCCLGPDATDELIGACINAVVGAVECGALTEERVAEAAGRVRQLAGGTQPAAPGPSSLGVALAGLDALGSRVADRVVRVDGRLPASLTGAHVVELADRPMMAAGEVPWGIAGPLAAFDAAATSEHVDEGADVAGILQRAAGRPLVIVGKEPWRHPAQRKLVRDLCVPRPDAVVVDLGWPSLEANGVGGIGVPAARVTSFGSSRVSGAAVARALTGGNRDGAVEHGRASASDGDAATSSGNGADGSLRVMSDKGGARWRP